MADKLTDEQVKALARCSWICGTDAVKAFGDLAAPHVVALAREVQASRQRRCGNCRWWTHVADQWGKCSRFGTPVMVTGKVPASWSCADFEERK